VMVLVEASKAASQPQSFMDADLPTSRRVGVVMLVRNSCRLRQLLFCNCSVTTVIANAAETAGHVRVHRLVKGTQ
jgi:hypothetical protein